MTYLPPSSSLPFSPAFQPPQAASRAGFSGAAPLPLAGRAVRFGNEEKPGEKPDNEEQPVKEAETEKKKPAGLMKKCRSGLAYTAAGCAHGFYSFVDFNRRHVISLMLGLGGMASLGGGILGLQNTSAHYVRPPFETLRSQSHQPLPFLDTLLLAQNGQIYRVERKPEARQPAPQNISVPLPDTEASDYHLGLRGNYALPNVPPLNVHARLTRTEYERVQQAVENFSSRDDKGVIASFIGIVTGSALGIASFARAFGAFPTPESAPVRQRQTPTLDRGFGRKKEDNEPEQGFEHPRVKLKDMVGLPKQTTDDVNELIAIMTASEEKRKTLGVKAIKGVVFYGPPGTGKSTLAEAIAEKTGRQIRKINGGDLTCQQNVGTGIMAIDEEFKLIHRAAKSGKPLLLQIDEVDSLFIDRGGDHSHDEDKKTLNAFLTQIDKLPENVVVIYTTNHLKKLDGAAIRNGRVDRRIKIGAPSTNQQRLEILKVYAKGKKLAADVNLPALAEISTGYVGADIKELMNQAAIKALVEGTNEISHAQLMAAKKQLDREMASRPRGPLTGAERPVTTFADVGGQDEVVDVFRKWAQRIKAQTESEGGFKQNREPIKPILVLGGPGTGKTQLARATANEANCAFFSVSGSEFVEKVVGVGAARVRELFEQARENKPAIIFIDEIDALIKRRAEGGVRGNDEAEQTLNQLLVEMDGLKDNSGVYVIGATNRPDVCDPAALRRFSKQSVENPATAMQRRQIIDIHVRNHALAPDVDLSLIAEDTQGYSGSELKDLIDEAAEICKDDGRKAITKQDFANAADNVELGKKSIYPVDRENQELVACHELWGHLVPVMIAKNRFPKFSVRAMTMEPRRARQGGQVMGFVKWHLPEGIASQSIGAFLARVFIAAGGRASERAFFGKENATSGGGNDYQQIQQILLHMVKAGMIPGYTPNQAEGGPYQLSADEHKLMDFIVGKAEEALGKVYGHIRQTRPELAQKLIEDSIAAKTVRNEQAEALFTDNFTPEQAAPLHAIFNEYVDSIMTALDTRAKAQQSRFLDIPPAAWS